MKASRLRRGDLQTASYDFRKGEREFRLIGVVHVAESSFWEATRARLADAESRGMEIHYELMRNDVNPKPPVKASIFTSMAKLLNLESQLTGVVVGPEWHNTDMTYSQMLTAAGTRQAALSAWMNKTSNAGTDLDNLHFSPKVRRLVRWFVKHALAAEWTRGMDPDVQRVVLDVRTDFAMKTMLARGVNVATIWGAGHLPRMAQTLLADGYELVDTTFVTAIGSGAIK